MGNTDSKSSSILLNHCIALVRPEDADASSTSPSPSHLHSPSSSSFPSTSVEPLSVNLSIFKPHTGPELDALFSGKPDVPLDVDAVFNEFYLDFISMDVQEFRINSNFKKILHIISDLNPPNFDNLIVFLSLYIIFSANSLPASRTGLHSSRLINAIKTLSVLIPIHFDRMKTSIQDHYDVFWATQHEMEALPLQNTPLGERLLLAILKLAFQEDFTTAETAHPDQLWEIGILTNSNKYRSLLGTHHQWYLFANRLLLLRLLAALFSSDLYSRGSSKRDTNMFLVYWNTQMPKDKTIQFASSLLNCTMRFLLNNSKDFQSLKTNFFSSDATANNWQTLYFQFIQSCLHILNLCMSYRAQNNIIAIFLTQLQREYDLKLILSSFIKIFKYPIDLAIDQESNIFNFTNNKHIDPSGRRAVSASAHDNTLSSHASLPNSSSPAQNTKPQVKTQLPDIHPLLTPMTILITSLIDCNKCFQNYFADKFASRFIIFSIYYLKYYDYSSAPSSLSATSSNSSTTGDGASKDTSDEHSLVELNENNVSQILLPLLDHLLLILTSKKLVLFKMLQTFNLNYYTNNLPNFYKLSNINGDINNLTFRDFTIIQLSNLILDNIKFNMQPNPIFYELIYNLLPINDKILTSCHKNDDSHDDLILLSAKKKSAPPTTTPNHTSSSKLSYNAAMSLLYILSKSSNKVYLTTYATPIFKTKELPYMVSPGFKMDLLALLLRSITIFLTLYFEDAENLLFAMARHQSICHQINDSINSISKALSMNPTLNSHVMNLKQMGFNRKVQWKDFYQFDQITDLPQVKLYSSSNQQQQNQNQNQNDSQGQHQNEDQGQDNESPAPYLLFDPASLNNENLGTTKHPSYTNHDKSYQIIAFIDFKSDPNLNLQHQLKYWPHRPQWPRQLTFTHKCKNPKYENFDQVWSGTVYLQILLRVVKQILLKVPEIPRIKSIQYFETLSKLSALKSDLLVIIHPQLPLDMRRLATFQPLSMHTNDDLLTWFHIAIWANIFTQTSFKYEESPSHELRHFESLLDINIDEADVDIISKPTTDRLGYIRRSRGQSSASLERTISAGSGVGTPATPLNRTKSNGSGNLVNYFLQNTAQSHFQHLRSSSSSSSIALERTVSNGSSIRTRPNSHLETDNNNNTSNNGNNNNNGGFSFFKWKWGGNNSNGNSNDSNVQGDAYADTPNNGDNLNSYMLNEEISTDVVTNIIESNIWIGTDIRLFKIANFRKESISFLEMTSSFFKKFKFINSDNDNYNNNEFDDNAQLKYTSRGLYR
ncbi:ecm30p [Saccharomyces arboricola H-6]|uniref:Ecm30p n=1 Tax=Saccharomyces arboricola (strain H-6 / AS 2.3317 / CBS 10644) TaxID=1160507 RepID=J8Q4Y2_SACAR|nr:ecm30p [Saccharomyces arboricola H-6]